MTTYKPARSSRSSNEGLLDETPINLATIPEELNFGVVCEGFVFTLQLAVHNKGVKPIFVRAHCKSELGDKNEISAHYEPLRIAPGMSMPMLIELSAFNAITSNFQLFIQEEMGNKILVKHVSANIVPLDLFKNVSKSLRLEDKPIYRHGVSLVDTLLSPEDAIGQTDSDRRKSLLANLGVKRKSVVKRLGLGGASASTANLGVTSGNSSNSQITSAFMDEDDIDEFLSLPIVRNVYLDPKTQLLHIDPTLGKVLTDLSWCLEESVAATNQHWSKACAQLELDGYQTHSMHTKMFEAKKLEDEKKKYYESKNPSKNNLSADQEKYLSRSASPKNLSKKSLTSFGNNELLPVITP